MFTPNMLYWWVLPLVFWSLIWKGIALWKCGRRNQLVWFIVILLLNTAGILPILYLIFSKKKVKKEKSKLSTKEKSKLSTKPKKLVVKKPVKKVKKKAKKKSKKKK